MEVFSISDTKKYIQEYEWFLNAASAVSHNFIVDCELGNNRRNRKLTYIQILNFIRPVEEYSERIVSEYSGKDLDKHFEVIDRLIKNKIRSLTEDFENIGSEIKAMIKDSDVYQNTLKRVKYEDRKPSISDFGPIVNWLVDANFEKYDDNFVQDILCETYDFFIDFREIACNRANEINETFMSLIKEANTNGIRNSDKQS